MPVMAATNVVAVAAPSVMETAPVTLIQNEPAYPIVARRRGLQGVVVIAIEVAVDGAPVSINLQRSSGHPVLDSAALNAVRTWRFAPARRAGQAVRATLEVPIRFRLAGVRALGATWPDGGKRNQQ